MRAPTLVLVCLLALALSGCVEEGESAPAISFTRQAGEEGTVFTVTKVVKGPVLWSDLGVSCDGGEVGLESASDEVTPGDTLRCTPESKEILVVHIPTDTLLFASTL